MKTIKKLFRQKPFLQQDKVKICLTAFIIILTLIALSFNAFAGAPAPTTYLSSSCSQETVSIAAGDNDVSILKITISGENISGGATFSITQMGFTMQNTVDDNVDAAKLYYTGTTDAFSTSTPLGTTVTNPTGNITFSFAQADDGTNGPFYYWLAFDIDPSATTCIGNTVDALFTDLTLTVTGSGAGSYTPTTPNPAGSREILGCGCWTYCNPSYTSAGEYIKNVTFNTINNTTGDDPDGSVADYTSNITEVARSKTYQLSVTVNSSYTEFVTAWFDWNCDGDFDDANERYNLGSKAVSGDEIFSLDITIPVTAEVCTTGFRIAVHYNASPTGACDVSTNGEEAEDYKVTVIIPLCEIDQLTCTDVEKNSTDNEIMRIKINTTDPGSVKHFYFNTTGTNNVLTSIENAKLYSTGNSSVFSTSNQIGSTVTDFSADTFSFALSGADTSLLSGANYFWLTYDIKIGANTDDTVDAVIDSVYINDTCRTSFAVNTNCYRLIAGDMVFEQFFVYQNTTYPVGINTDDNKIICVKINISGSLNPFGIIKFWFGTNGTTFDSDIKDAKLFKTGNSPEFNTNNQVGTTVSLPSGAFDFTASDDDTTLLKGDNYFWLTYSINNVVNHIDLQNPLTDTVADACCDSIKVNEVN